MKEADEKVESASPERQFKGVMVYLEHSNGQLEKTSLEALGKASEIAAKLSTSVTGVVLGNDIRSLAEEAIQYGADTAIAAESPDLENYTTEAYANSLGDLIRERKPEIFLLGATHNGRDLAGRLAVRLNTGLTAHAVRVEIEPSAGLLVCGVPGFGGSIVAICKCPRSRPQMATLSPGIFPVPARDQSRRGEIVSVAVNVGQTRTRVIERSVKVEVDITKADVLVIAGRGAEDQLDAVVKLASKVGAAVGVTRPLADKGLVSREHQVGSTGYAVMPKIAIVLGASGAAHFVSGIRDAKTVISVNKDQNALINNYADYIIVDDIKRFLPALLTKLEQGEVEAP